MRSFIRVLFLSILSAAASSSFAQDDVYYNPKSDKGRSGSSDANYEEQFNKQPASNSSSSGNSNSATSTDAYKYDDASRSASTSDNTDGYGNTYVTNNNYYYDDNDFYYTSRLRRYYTPSYGVNFWDPWYTDAFYYTRDPWMWGNSIYVSVIPSWNWWRPRTVVVYNPWGSWGGGFNNWNAWNSPWYGNGWNNCGWNSWGNNFSYGWNNYYGGNYYGGGNYWAYNNGYWNGYNNGYYDGAWNNGGGYGGRSYGMSGPRFQQSANNNNSGSNSLPGKSGKTDETNVPREGIVKPRNSPDTYIPPRDAAAPAGGVKERPGKVETVTPAEKYSDKKAPADGWKAAPANPIEENRVPSRVIEKATPTDRWNQSTVPSEQAPVDKQNRNWDNTPVERPRRNDELIPAEQPRRYDNVTPAERPSGSRIDRMREDFNREMQPVERPNRAIEQPQRVAPREEMRMQPEQRNYQTPQREIQRSEPQRIERQMPQREMQQMQQPQRQFNQQAPREAPRMDRMNSLQQPSKQAMPGRRP